MRAEYLNVVLCHTFPARLHYALNIKLASRFAIKIDSNYSNYSNYGNHGPLPYSP